MVPLVVERQAAVAVRGLPSAVTRAPASGACRWSNAYGCFDGCCGSMHGLVTRVPPCGSPAEGWSLGSQERWITTQRSHTL
jgi:hypothetical protein